MIRIAMLGGSEINGHPYSWSAIINGGYNKERMKKQPFSVIYEYLSKEPKKNLGIEGAKVTHVWAEKRKDAEDIAACSLIDNVADSIEDVIGKVDAVIIGEDIGAVHLQMAKPFIEKGIPIFIDKPLTDNNKDLYQFIKYYKAGKKFLSSSGYSSAKELEDIGAYNLGDVSYINCLMNKSWERYGIHAVEGIYKVLGSGIGSVINLGREGFDSVHLQYKDGRQALISQVYTAGIARFDIIGSKGTKIITEFDTFYMFKNHLTKFINFVKTGEYPFPFEETIEKIKVVIAGLKSRKNTGKRILIR